MYLKNVNRGLSFTKAGTYTTGLVIILGLLATSSGSNAFFIALGFGLSLLIISGLLSERSMKYLEFVRVGAVEAEAGKPFAVPLVMSNQSPTWFLFGIETLLTTELPRFRFLNAKLRAPIEARLLALGPLESIEVSASCDQMSRGLYEDFFVIQRTLFPFGLISKFKVSRSKTAIVVLPAIDPDVTEKISREITHELRGHQNDEEFHSHRTMTHRDPRRNIDWKKNAGKAPDQWVVRTYHSPAERTRILIKVDWNELRHSPSEETYEGTLSLVRTACEAILRSQATPILELETKAFLTSYESIKNFLLSIPKFHEKLNLKSPLDGQVESIAGLSVIYISGSSYHWRDK